MPDDRASAAVEQAARRSYGRLLAFLAARSRDVTASEDCLADAFHAALTTWPRDGVPDNPDAWLLTVARRRAIDLARRTAIRQQAEPDLILAAEEAGAMIDATEFPDERLKLLFVCAHPAIDTAMHTPLMLQTVLGLNAIRIASAFLVSPDAMGRRLSRAKAKIRGAHIPFDVPEAKQLPARLHAVLEAIYAAYGSGWDDLADPQSRWLPGEAISIGRTLVELMPGEPEALGLLSLMLHCEARREARRDDVGNYVPLSEQDVARWSQPMIEEAEQLLASAARAGRIGPFQIEAAIQSAHAQRAATGVTDWQAIALLYEGLVRMAPTIGALVGRAAALAEAHGAEAGLATLKELPAERVATYQPYWALRAHLLAGLRRVDEAQEAYARAIGLCADDAMRRFLIGRAAEIRLN
jgi:RNA polymerase sigma-70 factor (ECF subfamily)